MTVKIDHIAIAVKRLEDAIKLYCSIFGLRVEDVQITIMKERKMRTAILPIGESVIQLLESTDSEGAVAKHITEKGEGIHHLGVEVRDIQAMLKILKENDVPIIDTEPRPGHDESKIAFINPQSPKILIELVEY